MGKLINIIFIIIFLFSGSAYPLSSVDHVRIPLNSLKANRLQKAQEQLRNFPSKKILNYVSKEEWQMCEKAVEEKFYNDSERKIALKQIKIFIKILIIKKIDAYFIIQNVMFKIIEIADNLDEFKLFIKLGIKLARNRIDPEYTLRYGIPAIIKSAKNLNQRKLLLRFAMNLAGNNIEPWLILEYGLPSIIKTAENMKELKLFIKMADNIAESARDPVNAILNAFNSGIPAVKKASQDINELKLFTNTASRVTCYGIMPSWILEDILPFAVKLSRNPYDLKYICDQLIVLAEKNYFGALDYWRETFSKIIPEVVKKAKNVDEVKQILELLIIEADSNKNSSDYISRIYKTLRTAGNDL